MRHTKTLILAYPFGMGMTERAYTAPQSGYRFGFNGQEGDDEVRGHGNSLSTYFRQLDPRLCKWFSLDPKGSVDWSPYTSMNNNPIVFNDIFGDKIDPTKLKDCHSDDAEALKSDFEKLSGLKITENMDGTWGYEKIDGKTTVNGGSKKARKLLIRMIDSDKTIKIDHLDNQPDGLGKKDGVPWYSESNTTLYLDKDFSQKLRDNAQGPMNPETVSEGLIAFHEAIHWYYGTNDGPVRSQYKNRGPTVRITNRIRKELGYEQRFNYKFSTEGHDYIAFDKESLKYMKKRGFPDPKNAKLKYIRLKAPNSTNMR